MRGVLLITSLVAVATAARVSAGAYSVRTIQFPGDTFTQALGINDFRTVAGFHGAAAAQGFTVTPADIFTPQNFPGSTMSMATALNNGGSTAGTYVDGAGFTHGYTDIGGTFQTVDAPGTAFNETSGINSGNVTVGYSSTDSAGQVLQVADSQSGGVFTNINALLPANQNSHAVGINDLGNIVGFYQPTSTTSIGFLDIGGTITTIDPFGSAFTQALGINNLGEIVGFYTDAGDQQHGYVDFGGVFTTFDPTGSLSTTINGVNNLGQIAGFFTQANDMVIGFVGTPGTGGVPEPATWALMLLGFGAVGISIRRNKRIVPGLRPA